MRVFSTILFVAALAAVASAGTYSRKQLAGPPSDFATMALPDPAQTASESTAIFSDIYLRQSSSSSETLTWTDDFPVDSDDMAFFTLLSPIASSMTVFVTQPGWTDAVPIGKADNLFKQETDKFGMDGTSYPSTTWVFSKPAVGVWTITVEAPASVLSVLAKRTNSSASVSDGMLQSGNLSPYIASTYIDTHRTVVGAQLSVRAQLFDDAAQSVSRELRAASWRPTPLRLAPGTMTATIDFAAPDGATFEIPMNDEGLNGDLAAEDGVFGGVIPATESGFYRLSVRLAGVLSNGVSFERSVEHQIGVVNDHFDLSTAATATVDAANEVLHIRLSGKTLSQVNDPSFKIWAQAWGADKTTGADVPIAWISTMADVVAVDAQTSAFDMQLNLRWIAQANAVAPFSLRAVRVQDRVHSIPVDEIDLIQVSVQGELQVEHVALAGNLSEVTHEMRNGRLPDHLFEVYSRATLGGKDAVNGKLVLIHGYCSLYQPWPATDFTNAIIYENFNKNYGHDEYARMLIDWIAAHETSPEAFSAIGHSQGGPVLAHLLTYYNSGLDVSVPLTGSTIQSIGSPYQGCSMAGGLANIGQAFGSGCGENTDLTVEGAAKWLPGIPADKLAHVFYYRTQYPTTGLLNYCNLASNLILQKPNDGVAEIKYTVLPGATDMGITVSQCHSIEMKWPAQSMDATRNAILNANSVF